MTLLDFGFPGHKRLDLVCVRSCHCGAVNYRASKKCHRCGIIAWKKGEL